MKYKSLLFSCLMAGTGLVSSQAMAGGAIGGNCCADLEERVAELEATTVRKGNRRVTLQVSGNVHAALLFSDAPNRKNDTEIIQQAATQSKFRFVGKARISSDVYAGYRVEFGIGETTFGAFNRDGSFPGIGGAGSRFLTDGAISLRYNEVFIGSKTLGKLSIGQGETASDFAAQVDLSGTIYFAGGNLDEYHVVSDLDGFSRQERIRYDTPTIAGFRASASWQDNESWDAALRYGGALGDFTVAAAIAYFETGDGDGGVVGSASVLHRPTGLSLTAAAGDVDEAVIGIEEYWYVKAGIQRKIFAVGKSKFSVDYKDINDGDVEKIGAQFVQDIDAANMKIFASVWDADSDSASPFLPSETAGVVGMTINF
ncbi:MAG: porin [Methyloligellaceae bacterium]